MMLELSQRRCDEERRITAERLMAISSGSGYSGEEQDEDRANQV
jgi:hypothetical protein